MKIFVTGIGVTTAIGIGKHENFHSLQQGKTGIRKSPIYNLMTGVVGLTNQELCRLLNLKDYDYSRTTLLGLLAAREAWGNRRQLDIRTGLINGTCVGALDRMEQYYFDKANNTYDQMVHDNGSTTEWIAKELGISGYIDTVSTACSSGANAIVYGANLMEAGKLDRVVVGGSDPLSYFNINGFKSLNIYDPDICKPFDHERKGLNLGEGAAYLVLENENSISETGSNPICAVTGWNNSTDAFHQTASSPEGTGAYLAMKYALTMAGISCEEIDYINAHGTGTGNNDLSESMALNKIFGDRMPPFSSTKGFTGHTLGAAGAIEAVYSVMAIERQVLLANLNFSVPMKEIGLIPQTDFKNNVCVNHVLSNSFGFGGNCTSLVFSKV